MHSNPNYSLYEKAKEGAISFLKQVALAFLIFTFMLLITGGNPPSWAVAFTFCTVFACVVLEEIFDGAYNPFLNVLLLEGIILVFSFIFTDDSFLTIVQSLVVWVSLKYQWSKKTIIFGHKSQSKEQEKDEIDKK